MSQEPINWEEIAATLPANWNVHDAKSAAWRRHASADMAAGDANLAAACERLAQSEDRLATEFRNRKAG